MFAYQPFIANYFRFECRTKRAEISEKGRHSSFCWPRSKYDCTTRHLRRSDYSSANEYPMVPSPFRRRRLFCGQFFFFFFGRRRGRSITRFRGTLQRSRTTEGGALSEVASVRRNTFADCLPNAATASSGTKSIHDCRFRLCRRRAGIDRTNARRCVPPLYVRRAVSVGERRSRGRNTKITRAVVVASLAGSGDGCSSRRTSAARTYFGNFGFRKAEQKGEVKVRRIIWPRALYNSRERR